MFQPNNNKMTNILAENKRDIIKKIFSYKLQWIILHNSSEALNVSSPKLAKAIIKKIQAIICTTIS